MTQSVMTTCRTSVQRQGVQMKQVITSTGSDAGLTTLLSGAAVVHFCAQTQKQTHAHTRAHTIMRMLFFHHGLQLL